MTPASSDLERYLYVFVRQDIPTEHQEIQAGHAIYGLVFNYRPDVACPNHIHIGVPDLAALKRVLAKLNANQIPHFCWVEPDYDFGFTAIATAPLTEAEKQVLSNYRLLSHGRGAGQPACGLISDSPTNTGVAQVPEHRAFSSEVAGGKPAPGANLSPT